MASLDELNQIRQSENWELLLTKSRDLLQKDPGVSFALRAMVQALERLNRKDEEYEGALYRLLELKDRLFETAQKLAQYYKANDEKEEAIRHLEIAIEAAIEERQYNQIEDSWMELSELTPDNLAFFFNAARKLNDIKQHQRASVLLQMLLPACDDREDWNGRYQIMLKMFEFTPKDPSLRDQFINTLQKMIPGEEMERVLTHSQIRNERPLGEAMEEIEMFMNLLPDCFVRHPDWGIGRVKILDMDACRVTINFQRKRNHLMDVNLARKAVSFLDQNDFRVRRVMKPEDLAQEIKDHPGDFFKSVLKSLGGSLTAKEIKENLVPHIINVREWNSFWNAANSAVRSDPYVSVSSGSNKRYTIRETAASDEDELLQRFDETKAPHSKVDLIYCYLRTTKKNDLHDHVIRHFSQKIQSLTPRRRSKTERVELWFTNDDLTSYVEGIEPLPEKILEEALQELEKSVEILQRLRFKSHQLRCARRIRQIHQEEWPETFESLLLEPDVMIRDELTTMLTEDGHENRIVSMVDEALANFRKFPHTFIWLSERSLTRGCKWLDGKISPPVIIERLLLLIDYLTSQAKRREKDESNWLRKVAGNAREIIRKNRYAYFKEHIAEADESVAQSIYRRAQTNEGIDARTAADLTSFVRARFPDLFAVTTEETSIIPEGLLCLKASLERKQALLKRLIEIDLPTVVIEIETAREHGDLKENAEYHAARDRHKLLSAQTSELQEALHIAKPIELRDVKTDSIGFGTLFRIAPFGSDIVEEYVMLGPWESNPDDNVLSYQAPFARFFIGKKVDETIDVELPLHTGRYTIVSIQPIPSERIERIPGNQTTLSIPKESVVDTPPDEMETVETVSVHQPDSIES